MAAPCADILLPRPRAGQEKAQAMSRGRMAARRRCNDVQGAAADPDGTKRGESPARG